MINEDDLARRATFPEIKDIRYKKTCLKKIEHLHIFDFTKKKLIKYYPDLIILLFFRSIAAHLAMRVMLQAMEENIKVILSF